MWHHPKYYKELRKRNKLAQVISDEASTEVTSVHPGPGPKPQAPSHKQQATSLKLQAYQKISHKPQAPSSKPQASSRMNQEP